MSAVYFARVGGFVKIGFASNPEKRAKTLLGKGTRLIIPDGLNRSLSPEIIFTVPECRMRDERNMQLLFARYWVVGEWFHWCPAFEYQMRTMRFVTVSESRKHLRAARRAAGFVGTAHHKQEHWGKQTPELLAELAERRPATSLADVA